MNSKSEVLSINSMFQESTNRVLWRMMTGKPIEGHTASWLNDIIRDTFRMAERSKLSHLLQARVSFFTIFCLLAQPPISID